ncbi:hypothetical protein HYS72_02580, partial [Candidatus Pacearchaeota archaeon]|nr:hypothetical protein [Candidatus Pacearchaeota archaeon]
MGKENMTDVVREYDALSVNYNKRWEGYLNSTHDTALKLSDIKNNEKILDASGGTGLFAERILNSKKI